MNLIQRGVKKRPGKPWRRCVAYYCFEDTTIHHESRLIRVKGDEEMYRLVTPARSKSVARERHGCVGIGVNEEFRITPYHSHLV